MKLTDFKVLSFDCYGTLIDWETGMFAAYQSLIARSGKPFTRDQVLETHARHELDQETLMLSIAQRKFGQRAEFILHDLSRPLKMFGDRSFDLILSSLTIHYIEDQFALFSEFYRILRPGGQIVFSTHHPAMDFQYSPSQDYFRRELLAQDWDTIGRPVTVRFYRRPLSEITAALASSGFVIEAMTEGCLTDELRERYPDVYARLSKNPQFLFFRAAKRSSLA